MTQNNIYFADYGDRASNENWKVLISRYPEARRVNAGPDKQSTCRTVAAINTELNFWLIDGHYRLLDSFELYYASSILEYDDLSSTRMSFGNTANDTYVWKDSDNNYDGLNLLYVPAHGKITGKLNVIDEIAIQRYKLPYNVILVNYGYSITTPYKDDLQVTAQDNELDTWKLAAELSTTDMFWLIDCNVTLLDSFDICKQVEEWETPYVNKWPDEVLLIPKDYNFDNEIKYNFHETVAAIKVSYDIVTINYGKILDTTTKQVTAQYNELDTWKLAAKESTTPMFWLIDSNVTMLESFDLKMNIPNWDTRFINQWPEELLLIPKYYDFDAEIRYKYHKGLACIRERPSHVEVTYDTIFLSYNESNAAANLEQVKKLRPNVKHVNGIKGIFNAHKAASQLSRTDWFWVIDGDNYLLDSFDFTVPKNIRHEPPGVFVFACLNKCTDMSYGNGGIKLMHKSLFDMDVEQYVDLTTSFENFTYIDVVASETHIATDEFNSWRAAFRECAKLSTNIIKNSNESINRIYLNAWLYANNSKYSDYIRLGAEQGRTWARNNPDQLHLINDYTWLEQYYKENT